MMFVPDILLIWTIIEIQNGNTVACPILIFLYNDIMKEMKEYIGSILMNKVCAVRK